MLFNLKYCTCVIESMNQSDVDYYETGRRAGWKSGVRIGFKDGYDIGSKDGYKKGHKQGWNDSVNDIDVDVKNGMDLELDTSRGLSVYETLNDSDTDADGNVIPVGY